MVTFNPIVFSQPCLSLTCLVYYLGQVLLISLTLRNNFRTILLTKTREEAVNQATVATADRIKAVSRAVTAAVLNQAVRGAVAVTIRIAIAYNHSLVTQVSRQFGTFPQEITTVARQLVAALLILVTAA